MPYKDYTIERSGDNYTIRKPNGERMESAIAATLATAKKWIDLDIAERQAHARRWAREPEGIEYDGNRNPFGSALSGSRRAEKGKL